MPIIAIYTLQSCTITVAPVSASGSKRTTTSEGLHVPPLWPGWPPGLAHVEPLPVTQALAAILAPTRPPSAKRGCCFPAFYAARRDLQALDPMSSPEFDQRLLRWACTYGVGIDSDARYLKPYRIQFRQLLAKASPQT